MATRVRLIANGAKKVADMPRKAKSAPHRVTRTTSEDSKRVGEKGASKRGGRKAGTPNKVTTALKEAIILAAAQRGADGKGKDGLTGYLRWLAKTEPRSFAALLGRVVPLHITGGMEHTHKVLRSKEEVVAELRERGLPIEAVYKSDLDMWVPDENDKGH